MPFFSHDQLSDSSQGRAPALRRLFEKTEGCTSENFWDFECEFAEFFRSDFLSTFLKSEVSKVANETDYDGIQSDDEVELVRGNGFRISMGKLKASSALASNYSEIICYASDFMGANLGPSALEVDIFKFPEDRDIEYFDRTIRPIAIGRREQKVGEIIKARAGIDVLRYSPPSNDTFQIYAVALRPKVPLLWHFDAHTLFAKYCTSANPMSSRVQTGIEILVRMGRVDAIPRIVGATKSKDHFVRWTALTSVACMDKTMGIRLLEDALADPHPDVRSAASDALDILISQD